MAHVGTTLKVFHDDEDGRTCVEIGERGWISAQWPPASDPERPPVHTLVPLAAYAAAFAVEIGMVSLADLAVNAGITPPTPPDDGQIALPLP